MGAPGPVEQLEGRDALGDAAAFRFSMLNGGHPVAGQSVGDPHHQAARLRPDVKSVVDALQRSVPAPRMRVLFGGRSFGAPAIGNPLRARRRH